MLGLLAVMVSGTWPIPPSVTGEPLTGMLDVIVTDPVAAPYTVGANATLMVQVAPAFSVVAQLLTIVNGPVTATAMAVSVAVPILLSVRVCAAEVEPTRVAPKVSEAGETTPTAIGPLYWTAPMSYRGPGAGRGLPKKSVLGAWAPLTVPVPVLIADETAVSV